jgi:CRP-like cAMP-binding protein
LKNQLLQLLSEPDLERLKRNSSVTWLPTKKQLHRTGERVDAVYFPVDCVVSMLVGAGEEERVEMATIGNEGAVGAYALLNGVRSEGDTVVQMPGEALRVEAPACVAQLNESEPFRRVVQRYLFALTRQVLQAGACNRLHTMEERCARWLLMMHDRTKSDTFPLTQEFLAEMLGVRRATVNLAVGMLKSASFIQYARGHITIIDRTGLEAASCACYGIIRQEFQRVISDADPHRFPDPA